MPVGGEAEPRLLLSPAQRRRCTGASATCARALFAIDFQNDAEFVGGCIASGRRYLHINANGDVEPCVFIHYHGPQHPRKDAAGTLRSPLMIAYHEGQPFSDNMLRPCPMLENPAAAGDRQEDRRQIDRPCRRSPPISSAPNDRYAALWQDEADRRGRSGWRARGKERVPTA